MMQGSQYDRPSDTALEMARKVMGGSLGRVKDRLDVTPPRRQLPATLRKEDSAPVQETPNEDGSWGGPMVVTTTYAPGMFTTVARPATAGPALMSRPWQGGAQTVARAHAAATADILTGSVPGDRQLDRLDYLAQNSSAYGDDYRQAYYDTIQVHLDAEAAALKAKRPLPPRPSTAPSRFSSVPPKATNMPSEEKPHEKFVDSHTWVPPTPQNGVLGTTKEEASTKWEPTFFRVNSSSHAVCLRSDEYRPTWSQGLERQRPRTAGWSRGDDRRGGYRSYDRQRPATMGHHRHTRARGRVDFDEPSDSVLSRDVRDVLFGEANSAHVWHPHDVREDLFLNKGSDAERAAGYGRYAPRGPARDAYEVDDGEMRELTAQAMDKVVDKVVRKIMTK